ncbi:DUF4139 domain-containing protein [Jiella sp. KSK16Y-1]|uniref:DUF4139 domain-containing protein n=2 Tax=Jiella mangrovi TaxID=2821407 RepID=A0ABS4BGR6_9HYPH|nr:DUF4139 domain-containing protein [Jiella mangrovi]
MHNIPLITAAALSALMATTTLSRAQTGGAGQQPAKATVTTVDQAARSEPARTGDIRSIVLYSGGVAEIVRSAAVSGNATVGMEVPLDQVNDVLKSLVLRNPGGGVGQVSLEGSVNAKELSRAAHFAPADLNSLPLLLNKLKGAKVRIEGSRSVTGTVLGTSQARIAPDDKAETPLAIVSILSETGEVRSMPIFADTGVEILDEKTAQELQKAAASLAQSLSDDTRLVSVKVEGSGERTIELDYVVAAPVWKSSHRLVLGKDGKGSLQSWAVIENATGENWQDVKVSLSSGSPVTLRQNLFDPYFKDRPEVPVFVDRQSIPNADGGAVPSAPRMAKATRSIDGASAFADNLMAAAPSPESEPFTISGANDVGEAVEGDVSVTYRLPQPVNLEAGSTLSVPIVDAKVPAERIAVFTPERGEIHPTAAVRLDNETGSALPAGIVTVYDASGYVGDSTLLPVPAGQERQVQFALDRKLTVNTTERPQQRISEIRVIDGVLRYKEIQERNTVYSAANAAGEDRKLVIDHPKLSGWELVAPDKTDETENTYRLEAVVPAGGTRDIDATYRFVRDEGFALVDASQSELLRFSSQSGDPEMAASLKDIAAIQGEKTDLDRQIDKLNGDKSNIYAAQDRIRENIKAVGPGDLRDSYLDMMRGQEDQLRAIDNETKSLEAKREAVEARLRDRIKAM